MLLRLKKNIHKEGVSRKKFQVQVNCEKHRMFFPPSIKFISFSLTMYIISE